MRFISVKRTIQENLKFTEKLGKYRRASNGEILKGDNLNPMELKTAEATLINQQMILVKEAMKEHDFTKFHTYYDKRLLSCETLDLLELLSFLSLQQVQLTPPTRKSLEQAIEIFNELLAREIEIPEKLVYYLMSTLAYFQDGQKLEHYLDIILRKNLPLSILHVEALLFYYSRNGPVSSMEKIINYCISSNIGTTVTFYSLLIDGYGKFNQSWKCLDAIRQAEMQGHDISIRLLGRALRSFGLDRERRGKRFIKSGIEVICELAERKNLKKTIQFNVDLLNAYRNTNQPNQALKLIHEISNNGDFDSSHLKTIGIMMDMFCKHSMVNEAADLLTRSLALDLPVDVTMFNTLLNGIRKYGSEEDLLYYFELMKNCNLKPDATTVGIMVSYYGFEKKDLEKAVCLHKESGVPDSRHSIGTFIAICLANNNLQEANKWYATLISAGMTPSSQILLSMMHIIALTLPSEKIITAGQKYFKVAQDMEVVDQNICKGLAILNIAAGKGVKESLVDFKSHILQFNVRSDASCLLLFADAVLRPSTFIKERARILPLSMQTESGITKIEGLEEFEDLEKNLNGHITSRQQEYYNMAKTYLI